MLKKSDLINFEDDIKKVYKSGKIKAPIHLSGNNEDQLIKIFKKIKKNDWVFSTWRNHYHALLKGIPKEWIKKEIIQGRSMGINNIKYKFYSSAIVGGILPIALGVAKSIQLKKQKNRVWVFIGDMTFETGVFHECYKYSKNFKLPIRFVVEDNNMSTNSPTDKVWNKKTKAPKDVIKYNYKKKVSTPWNWGLGIVLMKYKNELIKSMSFLAKKKNTIFLGQSVSYSGNAIYNTLITVPSKKKIELPVFEDVQMGISIGMALNGYVPVTCYPRFDFLICAINQLVNHLDKIRQMSRGELTPKVIIRTSIGSKVPLNGGPQHTQDYTLELKTILKEVKVIFLNKPEIIFSSFKKAYEDKESHSYLFVEHGDFYNDK